MCKHKRNHQIKPFIRFAANYKITMFTLVGIIVHENISSYTSISKEREIYMLYYTVTVKITFCKGFIQ